MSTRCRLRLPALALGLLSACGQPEAPPPDVSFTAGRPPAPKPPPDTVGGFVIEVPPLTLAPGEERQPCYLFPLDIQGPSRIVSAASVTTGPGMHHGNITTRRKTGEGVRDCGKMPGDHVGFDILEGGAVLFASSTQVTGTEWQSFPRGIGFRVRDGYEIIARMHYVNPTSKPLTISPRYQWYTIAEATLRKEVGPFAWSYSRFHLPPLSVTTLRTQCFFARPMHIVQVLPHMHALGRRFSAGFVGGPRDGRAFLDDDSYSTRGDSDVQQYDPAIDLSQGGEGEGASFSCTWQNTFDKEIGEGVGDNEMCILFGYAYPPENAYSTLALGADDCVPVLPPPPKP